MHVKHISLRQRMALTTALAATFICGYWRRSYADCNASGGGNYLCSGASNAQNITANEAHVTTDNTFSVNTGAGDAITISGDGGLSFTDTNHATIYSNSFFSKGLYLHSTGNDGGNNGAVTINVNGNITGAGSGIVAQNDGAGAINITSNGNAIALGSMFFGGGSGIAAYNTAIGSDINITTGIGSVTNGIDAGITAINLGTGVTAITVHGDVAGTHYDGIYALNNGANTGMTITANTGTTIISGTNGVTYGGPGHLGGYAGIHAVNKGGGATTITANGDITAYGNGNGIFADNYNAISTTDLTVTTGSSSHITGAHSGIYVKNYGSGLTSITVNGDVTGVSNNAIDARSYLGASGLTITNGIGSHITGAFNGIAAYGHNGATSITVNGDVTGTNNNGLYVFGMQSSSGITITTGASSNIAGHINGIYGNNAAHGDMNIAVHGSVIGTNGNGIYTKSYSSGSTNITVDGDVTGNTGIMVYHNGGTAGNITTSGTIHGTGGTAIALDHLDSIMTIDIIGGHVVGDVVDDNPSNSHSAVVIGGDFTSEGNFDVSNFTVDSGKTFTFGANKTIAVANNVTIDGAMTINNAGSSITGDTHISSGGQLNVGDNFSVSSSIINNGTIAIAAGKTLTTQNLSGTGTIGLSIQPTSSGAHGFISSTAGTLDLRTMTIHPIFNNGDVTSGEKLVIEDGASSVLINGINLVTSHGISWTLSTASTSGTDFQGINYNIGDLLLTAAASGPGGGNTVPPGVNGNSVNSLLNYTGSDATLLSLMSALNSDNYNKAGSQLRPDAHGGSIQGAMGSVQQAQNTVSQHMSSFQGMSGMNAGDVSDGVGFWMEGFGSAARQGTQNGVSGFDDSTYGTTFGADKLIRDNLRMGAALSYASTKVNDNGTRAGSGETIQSYIGNIYGTYTAEQWYLQSTVTFANHKFDTTRLVDFTGPVIAKGSFTAQQYGTSLEAGIPLKMEHYVLTPITSFSYNHFHQNGYHERGANGADLIVSGSNSNSYISGLGTKIASSFTISSDWIAKPSIQTMWMHQFNHQLIPNQQVDLESGGVSFIASGLKLPADHASISAGLDMISDKNITLSLVYNADLASHFISNAGQIKMRIDF